MKAFDEFPISISAYIADTQHLSTLQHGAYLLILMTMRRAGGWIPDDDRKLANIVKLTVAKWKQIAPDIRSLLISKEGKLSQKRILSDIEKQRDLSLKNASNGKSGGLAKALKYKDSDLANATSSPEERQSDRLPESDPANTRILELTSESDSKKEKKVRAKRDHGSALPSDWLPNDAHYRKGEQLGFSRAQIDQFAERMRNWAGSNAHRQVARKSNWDLAFHNWISDRADRGGPALNGGTNEANRNGTAAGKGGFSNIAARIRRDIADRSPIEDAAGHQPFDRH